MSEFDIALKVTLKHEGGYVNDPDDPGGETFRGVSRKNNPKWNGWNIIDRLKSRHPELSASRIGSWLDQDAHLKQEIRELYYLRYWQRVKCQKIINQYVAMFLFDTCVNMGPSRSSKILQESVNICRPREKLSVDGVIGPLSLKAINRQRGNKLLRIMIKERSNFYWDLCSRKPVMYKFLSGWHKRIFSFLK